MFNNNTMDELKRLLRESIMNLVEDEIINNYLTTNDVNSIANFIKGLTDKADELGISVDPELREIETKTESVELTEGFMDWLRSKKDKIFALLLTVVLTLNFASVANAFTVIDEGQNKYGEGTVLYKIENIGDLVDTLNMYAKDDRMAKQLVNRINNLDPNYFQLRLTDHSQDELEVEVVLNKNYSIKAPVSKDKFDENAVKYLEELSSPEEEIMSSNNDKIINSSSKAAPETLSGSINKFKNKPANYHLTKQDKEELKSEIQRLAKLCNDEYDNANKMFHQKNIKPGELKKEKLKLTGQIMDIKYKYYKPIGELKSFFKKFK